MTQNIKGMKDVKQKFEKLKKSEEALTYATPKQAAKLTKKIVKWKSKLFSEYKK